MTKGALSGTGAEKVEYRLPARPSTVARSQSNRIDSTPPRPPPHDRAPIHLHSLDNNHAEKSHPLPAIPPPPPSKSFYNMGKFTRSRNVSVSPTFLESFMAQHPRISRNRRRFAILIFTSTTLAILLVIALAVVLSRHGSDNGGEDGYGGGSGGGSGGSGGGGSGGSIGGGYGDGPTATESELQRHNQGIPRPPINHSNATGWMQQGQGDGTFYDPSVKNGAGMFQEGACEYPYINSVYDMVAALNKPDFGPFPIASRSPACGQCLQVTGPNGTVQVQIVDMCPECKSGSLDLTPGAFAVIANLDAGRVHITWERCP